MSSRYRDGDEEEEGGAPRLKRGKKGKRPLKSRASVLAPAEGNATVAEIFPNRGSVIPDGGGGRVLCGYRMATLAFGGAERERSPVCVGDRVRVEAGVIVGRCERRNRLIRPAPNSRDPLLHVLAANLDCLVVVAAARDPEFSAGIVDRFLVAASAQKIETVLCVNKTDLLGPKDDRPWSHYPAARVALFETSARAGRGLEALTAHLRGKTTVFCGHSGVGKTSLLGRLLGDDSFGRVGAVNAATGRGRHTTTGAYLFAGVGGSHWIDTPGIMNFGLLDVTRDGLLAHFPELAEASSACAAECSHREEPACGLRGLPRRDSFLKMRDSLPSGR